MLGGDSVDVRGAGDADDLARAVGRDGERAGASDVEVDLRGVEGERDPGALACGDRLLADGPGAGEGEGVRGEGGGRRELAGRVGGAAVVPLLMPPTRPISTSVTPQPPDDVRAQD